MRQERATRQSPRRRWLWVSLALVLAIAIAGSALAVLLAKRRAEQRELERLARTALEAGDLEAAAEHLRRALARRESAQLLNLLGRVYYQLGQDEAGLEMLMKSLKAASLKPEEALGTEGLYLHVGGALEEAETKLRAALEHNPDARQTRELLVVNLIQQGKFEAAGTEAQQGAERHPAHRASFLNLLAHAHLGANRVSEAESVLLDLLKQDPQSVETRINLSAVYFKQGRYDETQAALLSVLDRDPRNRQAALLLVRALQAGGRTEEAERYLRTLVEANPSDFGPLSEMITLQLRANRPDEALRWAETGTAQFPQSPFAFLVKTQVLVARGDLPAALEAIDEGLASAGSDRDTLVNGAVLAFESGDADRFKGYIKRLRDEHGPEPLFLRHLVALAMVQAGQYEEVSKYVAAGLPADAPETHHVLGVLAAHQGKLDEAAGHFQRATAGNSSLERAYFDFARLRLTQGDRAAAIPLLRRAIELAPGREAYYLALGLVYEQSGDLAAAIAVYREGVARRPHAIPLLNNLALVEVQAGSAAQAARHAHLALQRAPEDPNVLNTVGWVHYRRSEFRQAIPYLEAAAQRAPDQGLFRYQLGLGYHKVGRSADARRELSAALERGANAPWSTEARALLGALPARD